MGIFTAIISSFMGNSVHFRSQHNLKTPEIFTEVEIAFWNDSWTLGPRYL